MAYRKCTICGKDIVLMPSAADRAKRYGETPAYYSSLFTVHSHCLIAERTAEVLELIKRRTGIPK